MTSVKSVQLVNLNAICASGPCMLLGKVLYCTVCVRTDDLREQARQALVLQRWLLGQVRYCN